jgi:sialate O-acetylesterase
MPPLHRFFRTSAAPLFLFLTSRLFGLELPDLFSDAMVLQRDQPVPVWGSAQPQASVTVVFADQKKTVHADAQGRWRVTLDPLAASTHPRTLSVCSSESSVQKTLHNVLVGDVWLCSGQSNMAMTVDGPTAWLHVGGVSGAKEVVRSSENPLLRQFSVKWKTDTQPQPTCAGSWTAASPQTTSLFTATGYFFARELQRRLQIPIAIISTSWGGSSVESWISRPTQTAEADPKVVARMERVFYEYDHHEERVAQHVVDLAAWEKRHHREAPFEEVPAAAPGQENEWQPVQLPAPLSRLGCPHGGVVWLRRDFEIPTEWGSAWRLDFPATKAFHSIYVNGVKIQEATAANSLAERATRPSLLPKLGRPGKNTLLIRLHGYAGDHGLSRGPFALIPFNPAFSPIPMSGEWLSKVQKTFEPLAADAKPAPVAPVKPVLHWMGVPAQYNAMLHPLIPCAIKGVAWYQGESNVGKPHYKRHLQMLIRDWRKNWAQGDFPFLACQLPGFGPPSTNPGDSLWAECREAQAGILELPQTALVNLIDTCEDGDLHPLNKQDPGERLARAALASVYGLRDVPWSGPVFKECVWEGSRAVVTFDHAEGGLRARKLPATYRPNLRKLDLAEKPLELPSPASELQGFALCEMREQPGGSPAPHWEYANARIQDRSVVVWSANIQKPVALRYAWADHPVCNLTNAEGLPAFPFRTDQYPSEAPKGR